MTTLFIVGIGVASLWAAMERGVPWAFRWIVLPALIIVPHQIGLTVGGLPDPTVRRAAYVGVILGAIIARRTHQVIPRWRSFDILALMPVLFFSISFGLDTGMRGFAHRLVTLTLDWGTPYVLARAVLKNTDEVRAALRPLVFSSVLLAGLAVYECRMATRLTANLWNAMGFEVVVPRHATAWRWDYLRATAGFAHPITMATFFAMVTPLAALWGLLEPRQRQKAWVAVFACMSGCVAGLSRGPMLVLAVVGVVFTIVASPRRTPILLALFAIVLASSPLILEAGRKEAEYVRAEMDFRGNVESSHYRFALLMIYGERILDVGFWGGREVQTPEEYEKAWSIDNAYLFLFLTGGWLGGGSISLIVIILFCSGCRRILGTTGLERKILSAAVASFSAIAGCMANVWFAPDYAPFFFITGAMVFNLTHRALPVPRLRQMPMRQRMG